MRRAIVVIRHLHCYGTVWLACAVIVIAAGGIVAAVRPASAATIARATLDALPAPAPINVNKADWSGSAGFGSRRPAWFRDRSGVVHLQGALTQIDGSGKRANTLGTLPRAARPFRNLFTIVHTFNGTYAQLEISPSGDLIVAPGQPSLVSDYFFVSFEGITFRPAGPTTPINVNMANWTSPSDASRIPAWFTDQSGVVYLQGAVLQINSMGTGASLIGTLPPAARPARNVFTIALANNGAYADLEIARNGQITAINSRLPAASGDAFISLDCISYRR